jgi:hypothetical protein
MAREWAAFICAVLISDQDCIPRRTPDASTGELLVRSIPMMDAVMMAIAFAFFALSIAYCYACDRL